MRNAAVLKVIGMNERMNESGEFPENKLIVTWAARVCMAELSECISEAGHHQTVHREHP